MGVRSDPLVRRVHGTFQQAQLLPTERKTIPEIVEIAVTETSARRSRPSHYEPHQTNLTDDRRLEVRTIACRTALKYNKKNAVEHYWEFLVMQIRMYPKV